MNLTLKIWRQKNETDKGKLVEYKLSGVSPDMSFLEMMDMLNENLIEKGEDPIAFEHDCREGICGSCGLVINGFSHGPNPLTTTCQLHMRSFQDGDTIYIEPWRSAAFPIIKDLIVNRDAFDDIIQAGGYISVNTGSAPEANEIPVSKEIAEDAMDSAVCIGCGACVAACPNASAMLFTSAKVAHLGKLPQGKIEKMRRVQKMVNAMDAAGFGNCSFTGACEKACPKGISITNISKMNADYIKSTVASEVEA